MSFDLEELKGAVSRWGRVARVVVTDVRGSAPREVGASMLVWDGGQSGTIGGGRLEWEAAEVALETLCDGVNRVRRFALGPDLGQCCGGAAQVLIERFDVGNLPCSFPYMRPLGPQGQRPQLPANAQTGVVQGWFVENASTPSLPVWIYGAGHVGRALVDVLNPCPEVEITWVDTSPDRFPADVVVRALPTPHPEKAVSLAPRDAHHLILTYSHEMDFALCHALLHHGFASAGLIGSATKWARFRKRLGQLGHGAAEIDSIQCPIGDPSLGRHPQAIAIGVATSLLSHAAGASQATGPIYSVAGQDTP